MSIVQISKIQQRSGNLVDLPQLDEAEFGFASDEKRLFIGKTQEGIENIEVLTSYSTVDFNQINGSVGNLDIDSLTVSNGQILAFDGTNWVNRGGEAGGLITLGTVSNVKITGGGIDYVLTTDGTGNLNWTPKASILSYIENVEPTALTRNSTFATATDSITDLITLDSIIGYTVNTAVQFSGTTFGGISDSTYYYVTSVDTLNSAISVSTTQGGANVSLTTDTGNMALNIVGTVVITADSNFFTEGARGTITDAVGMTELNGGSFYLDIISSTSFALYLDPLFAQSVNSTNFTPYAYTTVTATTASTNIVTVGNTGSFAQYDPVIFLGTTFGEIVANQKYYIASIVSSTEIIISTTEDGGNVVVLTTAAGSATMYSPGGRIISSVGGAGTGNAGGTQYSVQYNNSNLLDGDANFTYDFAAKLLTLSGGNANVGNLNATGVVTATRIFSNVGTGIAPPLVVSSTDRVANLNVSYANVSDYEVVTEKSTGTFYPVFVNGSTTSNYALGVNSAFAFNAVDGTFTLPNLVVNTNANTVTLNASGNIFGANVYANSGTVQGTFLTGTLTTAAQPNITSLGNASVGAVTVTGNLNPSANIIYNLGNNLNRWNDLYLSGSTIYLGNATITSDPTGVVITNASGGSFTVSGPDVANTAAIVNGNSSVIVTPNSNVNISSAGNAVVAVTGTGVNVAGTLNATGNTNVGNMQAATGVFTTAANTGLIQNGSSNITITNNGNVSTFINGNAIAQLQVNGTGVLIPNTANIGIANAGTINSGLLQNGTSNITLQQNNPISVYVAGNTTARTVFTTTGVNVAGVLNVTANITTPQFISNVATGTAPLTVTSNTKVTNLNADLLDGYDTSSIATANTVVVRDLNGNVNGNYIIGNGAFLTGIDASLISNGTANVRTFNNGNVTISASGVANVFGVTSTNATVNANLIVSGTTSLGPISNVYITGGNANQILKTNGSGNLSWTDATGGYYLHTQSVASNTWTVVHNLNNQYVSVDPIDNTGNSYIGRYDYPTVNYTNANAVTLTFSSAVTGYCSIVGGGFTYSNGSSSATPGGLNTYVQFNDSGTLSGQPSFTYNKTTGLLTAGNTVTANFVTGTLTTSAQPNITSVGNLTSLTVTGNANANIFNANTAISVGSAFIANSDAAVQIKASTGQGYAFAVSHSNGSAYTEMSLYSNANVHVGGVGAANPGAIYYPGQAYFWSANGLALSGNGYSATGGTKHMFISNAGLVTVPGSTAATSTTSGAFQVTGGVGVGGNIHVGGLVSVTGTGLSVSPGFTNSLLGNPAGYFGSNVAGSPALQIQHLVSTNYPTIDFYNSSNTYMGAVGVGNPSVSTVNDRNRMILYAAGTGASAGWVMACDTGNIQFSANANLVLTLANGVANIAGALGVSGNITAANITANTGVFTGNGSGLTNLNANNISSGTLAQARLANSSLTVNGTSISLGGNATITANTTQTLTFGSYLTGTSFNGGTANTIAVDASTTNVANKVVARDANGNFGANIITLDYGIVGPSEITVQSGLVGNQTSFLQLANNNINLSVANNTVAYQLVAHTSNGVMNWNGLEFSTSNLSATTKLTTTVITTGNANTAGNITGNWTLTAGSKLQATYADLAEYYTADTNYEPGTVLEFGGAEEVTLAEDGTNKVAGVVSTNPAYVMNSSCEGKHVVAIALQGRVPCKVRGTINKGDMLISGGNGFARPTAHPYIGTVIGKALQNFDGVEGVIEVAVGRL